MILQLKQIKDLKLVMTNKIKIKELQAGDCLSELAHYRVKEVRQHTLILNHLEGKHDVELSNEYITNLLTSAEQYHAEIKVGKKDKYYTQNQIDQLRTTNKPNVGDLRQEGIESIFEGINAADVFTVCFKKADKSLTKKAYDAKVQEVIDNAVSAIEKARTNKKSVTDVAKEQLENLIKNPVLNYEEGEERILRGYKTQFKSIDGRYNCYDMDINDIRPCNINTIVWLVYKGVKYIVE